MATYIHHLLFIFFYLSHFSASGGERAIGIAIEEDGGGVATVFTSSSTTLPVPSASSSVSPEKLTTSA
jgi:hypothetical protein